MSSCDGAEQTVLPVIQPVGEAAVLVTFSTRVDTTANRRAHQLAQALFDQPLEGVTEAVPGYGSLLVQYSSLVLTYQAAVEGLLQRLQNVDFTTLAPPKTVLIPVRYGGTNGEDLSDLAKLHGLSEEEVIRLHTAREYPVLMMGFTPGFPYLGGLDPRLATARLSTPRALVRAGSVGIAGEQTGIYPIDSPGGWRIIGRTLMRLFDPLREPPFLLSPGDSVRFTREEE